VADLYGAFPVKRLFWVVLKFFVRSGKGRFSSRRLQSGSRSARKGTETPLNRKPIQATLTDEGQFRLSTGAMSSIAPRASASA
jgi:hypothetical protein